MDEAPDCQRCGACCLSDSPHHVRVSGDDYERLGEDAERVVAWDGTRAYLRLAPLGGPEGPSACAALTFDQPSGVFACTIYERRPSPCRELERGSPACAGELHSKGARTLPLLRRCSDPGSESAMSGPDDRTWRCPDLGDDRTCGPGDDRTWTWR